MQQIRDVLMNDSRFTESERADIVKFLGLMDVQPQLLRDLVQSELKPLLESPLQTHDAFMMAVRSTSRTIEKLSKVKATSTEP
jgi:hypothetical protein